jgi:hypothetical protein
MDLKFNLNLLSKYRLELMGISAILIILCHESYLTNVFVSYFLKEIPMITSGKGLFAGNYLYYFLVILLGILFAILTNKITNYILRK